MMIRPNWEGRSLEVMEIVWKENSLFRKRGTCIRAYGLYTLSFMYTECLKILRKSSGVSSLHKNNEKYHKY